MKEKFKFYFLGLTLICILVFILQTMISSFTDMFVLNSKSVYEYQYWRFITSIFLHGDLGHLALNMFALMLFGGILEKLIGSKKFLLVFFISGVIANLISVNFYSSSLGASGAIYGLIGCLTIIRPMMMVWAFGLILPMFIAAGLYIVADVLRIFGMNPGNVGSIAHLSGIAVGFIFGFFYRKKKIKEKKPITAEKIDKYIKNWEDGYLR